jgi:hypothetical protein
MSDRALITLGVLLLVAAACTFVGVFLTRMRRVFWMAGLSLALIEFAGATIGIAIIGISRGRLSDKGFAMLLVSGVAAWMIVEYLSSSSSEIREPKGDRLADSIDRLTDSR